MAQKNVKQLAAVTAGGGSVTLKNNGVNDFYILTGPDVTLTSCYTIGIYTPSKRCKV